MRDDIKLFIHYCRDMGKEPHLMIRVRSVDGMNEHVTVSEFDLMKCRDSSEKGDLIGKAIRSLAEMTILPAEDLLRMSAEGENVLAVRAFAFPKPYIVPAPTVGTNEPEIKTGWSGFLSGVTTAIMEAHKNYVLPKARVVKDGKLK